MRAHSPAQPPPGPKQCRERAPVLAYATLALLRRSTLAWMAATTCCRVTKPRRMPILRPMGGPAGKRVGGWAGSRGGGARSAASVRDMCPCMHGALAATSSELAPGSRHGRHLLDSCLVGYHAPDIHAFGYTRQRGITCNCTCNWTTCGSNCKCDSDPPPPCRRLAPPTRRTGGASV